ncbi:class I SAM-dependent methyltransferase [Streptomyces sp. HUAS TT3]|uniref:class I SAM-dependent methyltransferase n=1 Tax=Streptomyces sp. HUAS TT3 TaxID=3447510 RepID=UPI003F65B0C1
MPEEHPPGPPGSTPQEAPGRYGEALFRPEHPREGERIDHAALVYDPFTCARLRSLGVGPGWRCLEAGAGTGTVARWLADEAGADEVVALDRDTGRLAPLAGPRLRVREADLTRLAAEPDLGTFDLVHSRFVLMHLPERRDVVRALVERLNPGGCLVVSDAADVPDPADRHSAYRRTRARRRAPQPGPPGDVVRALVERLNPGGCLVVSDAADVPDPADRHSAYRRTLDAMWRTLAETIGTDVTAVRAHPHVLRAAGLEGVAAELVCPPLTAGAPLAAFWRGTWERMRPDLLAGRLDAATLDGALAYLASPALAELGPGMLTVWGRRPTRCQ